MSDYPECPFCGHRLTEPVPSSLDGPMKLRCQACEAQYQYIPKAGSFPLDDDLGLTITKGILGPHVVTQGGKLEDDVSLSRTLLIGGLCCCTIIVIIPVLLALLLAFIG